MNNKKKQIQIDFLGIGAQKSGTTWLYANLKKIPEFDLPPIKELHYFDFEISYQISLNHQMIFNNKFFVRRILDLRYIKEIFKRIIISLIKKNLKELKFFINYFFSNRNDNWYLSLFKNLDGYKGEITPDYSILEEQYIKNIYKLFPHVKLILILRNPVGRAWSHYCHFVKKFNNFSLDSVTHNEIIEFMEGKSQSLHSDYIRTIKNFSRFFPKNQILICFYDAIIKNPDVLLNDIIKFICGDKSISINHLSLRDIVGGKPLAIKCPKKIENYLKDKYHSQIKQLAEKYGGYFNKWYTETYEEKKSNENNLLLPTINLGEFN